MPDYGPDVWMAWECASHAGTPYGFSPTLLEAPGYPAGWSRMIKQWQQAYAMGVRRFMLHRPGGETDTTGKQMRYDARLAVMDETEPGDPLRKIVSGHAINAMLREVKKTMPGARITPYFGAIWNDHLQEVKDGEDVTDYTSALIESIRGWIDSPIVDLAFDSTMPSDRTNFDGPEYNFMRYMAAMMKTKGRRFYVEAWPDRAKYWQGFDGAIAAERYRASSPTTCDGRGDKEAVCWRNGWGVSNGPFAGDALGWLVWCLERGVTPCFSWYTIEETVLKEYGSFEKFMELGRGIAADNAGKVDL